MPPRTPNLHQLAEQPGCQRWRARRASYRPPGEPFDPNRHAVERIDDALARRFVEAHHYAGSYPATRAAYGLWRRMRGRHELAGVVAFSVPMSNQTLQAHLGVGLEHGIDIGRLVLLDEVEGNGESWTTARAMRAARSDLNVSHFVAFCDPVPRTDQNGTLVKPGHVGVVYRALNATLSGRTSPRTLWRMPNGQVLNGRAISKLRTGERGVDYVTRLMRAAGLRARAPGEAPDRYLAALKHERALVSFRHPGNLAFTWRPQRDRCITPRIQEHPHA